MWRGARGSRERAASPAAKDAEVTRRGGMCGDTDTDARRGDAEYTERAHAERACGTRRAGVAPAARDDSRRPAALHAARAGLADAQARAREGPGGAVTPSATGPGHLARPGPRNRPRMRAVPGRRRDWRLARTRTRGRAGVDARHRGLGRHICERGGGQTGQTVALRRRPVPSRSRPPLCLGAMAASDPWSRRTYPLVTAPVYPSHGTDRTRLGHPTPGAPVRAAHRIRCKRAPAPPEHRHGPSPPAPGRLPRTALTPSESAPPVLP